MERTSAELLLSILTPAVPSRLSQLEKLMFHVEQLIGALPVEHLVLIDNKKRTVGEKRDALLRAAKGKYVAFVDDDDWISDRYVVEIINETERNPDVITFLQKATINGKVGHIEFGLGNQNIPWKENELVRRNAWHVCVWRRTLAVQSRFPASNYGEDWAYAGPLCAIPGLVSVHIPQVLHHYNHSSLTTEAPPNA